jgi:hypothetical protein
MAKRNTLGAVVMVAVMVFGCLVACGGLGLALLNNADERSLAELDDEIARHKANTAAAIRAARPVLARHGLTELSDDTIATTTETGAVLLAGTGRGASDDLRKFFVWFHVAKFGRERRWEIEKVVIDDEVVLPANSRE